VQRTDIEESNRVVDEPEKRDTLEQTDWVGRLGLTYHAEARAGRS